MGRFHPDVDDKKFKEAKEQAEAESKEKQRTCLHEGYDFSKHGRHCTCGQLMVDWGD